MKFVPYFATTLTLAFPNMEVIFGTKSSVAAAHFFTRLPCLFLNTCFCRSVDRLFRCTSLGQTRLAIQFANSLLLRAGVNSGACICGSCWAAQCVEREYASNPFSGDIRLHKILQKHSLLMCLVLSQF